MKSSVPFFEGVKA